MPETKEKHASKHATDLIDTLDQAIEEARKLAEASESVDTFWGPKVVADLTATRQDVVNMVHRNPGDMDDEDLAALEPEPIAGDRPPEAGVVDEETGEAVTPEELEARQTARKTAKAKPATAES